MTSKSYVQGSGELLAGMVIVTVHLFVCRQAKERDQGRKTELESKIETLEVYGYWWYRNE